MLGVALVPGVAQASVVAGMSLSFPSIADVGQTGLPASVALENRNSGAQAALTNSACNFGDSRPPCGTAAGPERGITVVPSCSQVAGGECIAGDPGVFTLSSTATGRAGTQCASLTFDTTVLADGFGTVRFTPQGGARVTLPGFGASCTIDFTVDVVRAPVDQDPGTPGSQTVQTTEHRQFEGLLRPAALSNGARDSSAGTTIRAQPLIATQASPSVALGGSLTDVATLTGLASPETGVGAGTVTFRLFGPDDADCSDVILTRTARPLNVDAGGTSATADSGAAFAPATAGTYRWIAEYTGDAGNAPVAGACGDANEQTDVSRAQPTIATQASSTVGLGGSLSDVATVSGLVSPLTGAGAGTVTFRLFGPDDADCSDVILTRTARPLTLAAGGTSGTADSGAVFAPVSAGTYRWIAEYTGDANNAPVAGACGDANEQTGVDRAQPLIASQASPAMALGGALTDVVTVSGLVSPLTGAGAGTVTFTLFGPDDADCSDVILTRTARPLTLDPGGTLGTADSGAAFVPVAAGTYRWIASYTGDANNAAVAGTCGDADEQTDIARAQPVISSQASPTVELGGSLTDAATVQWLVSPLTGAGAGTVTFRLYGPDDADCSDVILTRSARPLTLDAAGTMGTADSEAAFVAPSAGTYRWIAEYAGDANNAPVAGACGDADEQTVVTAPPPPPGPADPPPAVVSPNLPPTPAPAGADTVAPTIQIDSPAAGANYELGQVVVAKYACTDPGGRSAVTKCDGPIRSGADLDTASPGTFAFVVNAADALGNVSAKSVAYTVQAGASSPPPDEPADDPRDDAASAGAGAGAGAGGGGGAGAGSQRASPAFPASPPAPESPATDDPASESAASPTPRSRSRSAAPSSQPPTTNPQATAKEESTELVSYDARSEPKKTLGIVAAALTLLTLATGGGGMARGGGVTRAPTGKAAGGTGERPRFSGLSSYQGVDVRHLEAGYGTLAPGDRSRTWSWPATNRLDLLAATIPVFLARRSPLLARVFADGSYLRAILGSASLLAPLAGLWLGIVAVQDTSGEALPPSLTLVIAITVLGVIDAVAGFTALVTFILGVLLLGGVDTADDLRFMLGIGALWAIVPVLAGLTRPLRREATRGVLGAWERGADFIVVSLVGAWAVQRIVLALPGLAGVELPIAAHANQVAHWVLAALVVRLILETISSHFYPRRLDSTTPVDLPSPSKAVLIGSAFGRTVIYAFLAYVLIGNCWQLWASAGLFLLTQLIWVFPERFPNSPKLYRAVPKGVTQLVFFLFAYTVAWLLMFKYMDADSESFFPNVFVGYGLLGLLLPLPLLLGRSGEARSIGWGKRMIGLGVLVVGVLQVQGYLLV